MDTFKITRTGSVVDRESGRDLGRVFRSTWIKPNGDGTGREIDVWKAEDRWGRWGPALPSFFESRREAATYLAVSR